MHTYQQPVSSLNYLGRLAFVASIALTACASTVISSSRAPGGFDLRPNGIGVASRGLQPYGEPDSIRAGAVATPDIDTYLKADVPSVVDANLDTEIVLAKRAAESPKPAANAPAQDATPLAEASPMPSHEAVPASIVVPDVDERYAARDQQAREQKQFRGGDTIVITGGAILLIALILLLILIVT